MPDQNTSNLQDLRPEQSAVVHSVNDDDPGFLRYLESQGLVPGVEFTVIDYSPYDDNLKLKVSGKDEDLVLGASVTAQIQVEVKAQV